MSEERFMVATIIAVLILALFVFELYLKRVKLSRDIEYLYKALRECTTESMYELERKYRRELQNEVGAIKEYLGVESVKVEPKLCLVKKEKNT